jgi:hypothetical protein
MKEKQHAVKAVLSVSFSTAAPLDMQLAVTDHRHLFPQTTKRTDYASGMNWLVYIGISSVPLLYRNSDGLCFP